jgi:hypothetical protein
MGADVTRAEIFFILYNCSKAREGEQSKDEKYNKKNLYGTCEIRVCN